MTILKVGFERSSGGGSSKKNFEGSLKDALEIGVRLKDLGMKDSLEVYLRVTDLSLTDALEVYKNKNRNTKDLSFNKYLDV